MKGMKDFIPTIDLHCNMVRGNTPLVEEILARVKKKQRCWQRYLETKQPLKYKEYHRVRNHVTRMTIKAKMSYEKDIACNAKSDPMKFQSYAKRKTSHKQGISHLQIGVCNDEGKSIFTTSDLDKVQVLSGLKKSMSKVENTSNIPPMVMRCHTFITTLDINERIVVKS